MICKIFNGSVSLIFSGSVLVLNLPELWWGRRLYILLGNTSNIEKAVDCVELEAESSEIRTDHWHATWWWLNNCVFFKVCLVGNRAEIPVVDRSWKLVDFNDLGVQNVFLGFIQMRGWVFAGPSLGVVQVDLRAMDNKRKDVAERLKLDLISYRTP